jgi:hypothetical protein
MGLVEYAVLVFYTFLDDNWVFCRFDHGLGVERDRLARWQSIGNQF